MAAFLNVRQYFMYPESNVAFGSINQAVSPDLDMIFNCSSRVVSIPGPAGNGIRCRYLGWPDAYIFKYCDVA